MNIQYMHLSAESPPPKYPKYISIHPECGVEELFGRDKDIEVLDKTVIESGKNLLVTAVGGLGKTELIKKFLTDFKERDVNECGIEAIAWVPYNNNDLRLSVKQAIPDIQCDLDEVWAALQNKADEYGKRLLLVIDNVELSDDVYLRKLCNLSCRIIVTSRNRQLSGFSNILDLQPLSMESCRKLFYYHYTFDERNNEILNDIIELTARLTIMVVFIAKAALLEEYSLNELYAKLVEKGFKLSEEDVSCEHEKMQNDETIIKQMCILFSLLKYSETDKTTLTYISVIPNLRFNFTKAKKWFGVNKNSYLMKLFNAGMLEHVIEKRTHIYWMHSVIAAAVREQQKTVLYEQCSPFIHELSEDLECGEYWGTAHTKFDLIPFSWSIADLLENNLNSEDDSTFLLRLFYICFEASNYQLCQTLIEKVLFIDKEIGNAEMLIRDYKNFSELYLRLNNVSKALEMLSKAEKYMKEIDPNKMLFREWAYLWHIYGNIYFHEGIANKALDYYTQALELDLKIKDLPDYELSTDYSGIASVYQMCGNYFEAYKMIKKAMELDTRGDDNSEALMNYYYLAEICTSLLSDGYDEYYDEALESYRKLIDFREKHLPKYSNDLADVYFSFSNFLYQTGENEKSLVYSDKACEIYKYLYGEESYSVMQCESNKALVIAEYDMEKAIRIYTDIIERQKNMKNIPLGDICHDYQNYADFLKCAERYEESIIYFQKTIDIIIEIQSEDSSALAQSYIGMIDCNMGLERYETALDFLAKAEKISGNDYLLKEMIYYKKALCYSELGNYDTASKLFLDALSYCKDSHELDRGYIYAELSFVSRNMGNIADSDKYKKMAVEFAEQANDEALLEYVNSLFIN